MIEGRQFIHPEFRLAFEAPSGFYMVNGTSAVSVNGQSGQAQLKTGPYSGDLERYVMQVYASLAQNQQLQPQSMERRTINGLPAIFSGTRVASGRSQVDVVVFAYEFSRTQAFHFVAITPAGRSGVFNPMFNSMRRISANEAAQVVPRVIDVVTVGRNDTVQSLSARMAYNGAQEQEARFRVLNGLTSNQALSVGQKVKLVVRAR
jgi:predicted Zn-dependent protease